MATTKRKALGRGLSALIPEGTNVELVEGAFFLCPVDAIEPNPYQPRQKFNAPQLQELVDSVREKGVITPLLVSKNGPTYRLIAGERRWRAAQKAGLERVPVVVRETSQTEALELALIENIHRQDLNPIEEAQAYQRLLTETSLTHQALSKRLAKDRSSITNTLRLLTLPQQIQDDLINGALTMGHARVLAGIKDTQLQNGLRDLIHRKGLSVRQLEALAKEGLKQKINKREKKSPDAYLASLSDTLKRSLGTKVDIQRRGKRGTIVIHFFSDDEFDRLFDILS